MSSVTSIEAIRPWCGGAGKHAKAGRRSDAAECCSNAGPLGFCYDTTRLRLIRISAEPLIDTIDSVINRALDALEEKAGSGRHVGSQPSFRILNPGAPPGLAHTTIKSIELCGRTLKPNQTYWNTLLIATLREAKSRGTSTDELKMLILGNCHVGRKEDEGYRFYKDLELSIQGLDSNAAWRATYHVAQKLGLSLEVKFVWQDNPKAAFPGSRGIFVVGR
jgi:hypothetical protein